MATPILHQTDLFHPHADPDDHWDLACVFALAAQRRLRLAGVLIDYPPSPRHGDPAVISVAQLGWITGLAVPVAVGVPQTMTDYRKAAQSSDSGRPYGAAFVLETLQRSAEPLAISIVGSCRDVAIAGAIDPDLFARKCRGIYLNAGTGTNDPELRKHREYNVTLDPPAFRAIFDLPCPVYWMPCFYALRPDLAARHEAGAYGTHYTFLQSELFPFLTPRMRQYFIFMFEHSSDPRWLAYLDRHPDQRLLETYGAIRRSMWCTAGFFHAAGLAVTEGGDVVPVGDCGQRAVCTFEPVRVTCAEDGTTMWEPADGGTDRYIFRVTDQDRYGPAMTAAMGELLADL